MTIDCHEVERVENLMYEGCESHWHCIHCDDYWPFHCYGKKDLEQMKCPARKQKLAFANKDAAYCVDSGVIMPAT